MVKLTEQMVIARTKQSNLSLITKFNCCGASLSDVSILRHMPNVTVLSLSVNNIASLEVFKYCSNLQELFVRRNLIKELNEVCYLQDLRCLKILWLAENPCAQNFEEDVYRLTVIKALPRLNKLDNLNIEEHEMTRALRHNRILIHPEKLKSPEESYSDHEEVEVTSEDAEEIETPEMAQAEGSWEKEERLDEESWPDATHSEPATAETPRVFEAPTRSTSERFSYEQPRPANDRRYEVEYQAYPTEAVRQQPIDYSCVASPVRESPVQEWSQKSETDEAEDFENMAMPPQTFREETSREEVLTRSSSFKNDFVQSGRAATYSSIPRSRTADEFGYSRRTSTRQVANNCTNTCPRRPPERKRNILNAILCLVKELDLPNLTVVEHAVQARMDELENSNSR